MRTTSDDLIDFYSGSGPDNRGRTLIEIQSWSDEKLEAVHDYIQWLFPLDEGSAFNGSAPILDAGTIAEFCAQPALQENVRKSFRRMLQFYGFDDGEEIKPAPNFAPRAKHWLTPGNHNHLRITRILKSLRLLGLTQEADAFFAALTAAREQHPRAISDVSFGYWSLAASHRR